MTAHGRIAGYVLFVALVAVGVAAGVARGEFVVVEDFDDLELREISGQNGWFASSSTSEVITLPGEGANQSLMLTATPAVLHKSATIEQGNVRMLFLRFRFEGQHNYSFGMSHLSAPDEFRDFGPELRKSAEPNSFKIRDDNNYDVLATLDLATWYNCWVRIDTAADQTQVWLHLRPGEGATAADLLNSGGQTVFDFRTNTNGDLVKFYMKTATGSAGSDPLWIDDIYLEDSDSLNLANPVPEPHSLVCLGSAAIVLMFRLGRFGRRT